MKTFFIYVIALITFIGLGIGLWNVKRHFNYKFGYESLVHEQIQKELKPILARLDALEKQIKLGK